MNRALLFGAALVGFLSAPAIAQHAGHGDHDGHAMPSAAADPVSTPAPMAMPDAPPVPESPAVDPHAGHMMPMPTPSGSGEHVGHGTTFPTPPLAPPPPAALTGPDFAADDLFGARVMTPIRDAMLREHGGNTRSVILIERLEYAVADGDDGYAWDVQAWSGGDTDRFWFKTAGEGGTAHGLERGDAQFLWSHAVHPFWDVQAGLRQDFGRGPDRTHAVLGLRGLTPYWIHLDAALFLSTKGDVTASVEVTHDARLTQHLVLQPRVEAGFAAQDVPDLGEGAGLSTVEAGLRLRYAFAPEFAPYIGVDWQRAVGATADMRRAAGDSVGGWRLLVGIRAWF
jgi:copper resistance protein B